ncbi:hypothetical protein WA158_008524 [Blastocystis sp. Blastoise]
MDPAVQNSKILFDRREYAQSLDTLISAPNYLALSKDISELMQRIPEMDLENTINYFNQNDAVKLYTLIYQYLAVPQNNGRFLKIFNLLCKHFSTGLLCNAISQL